MFPLTPPFYKGDLIEMALTQQLFENHKRIIPRPTRGVLAKGPGRRRILVAEDEEAIAALIQYNLETAGYGVTILSDGDKASEEAKADPPQAMLLD